MLTALLVAWAVRSFEGLRVTGPTLLAAALLLVVESGVDGEGVKRTIRQ